MDGIVMPREPDVPVRTHPVERSIPFRTDFGGDFQHADGHTSCEFGVIILVNGYARRHQERTWAGPVSALRGPFHTSKVQARRVLRPGSTLLTSGSAVAAD